jgi:hypothetical protein
MADFIGSCYPPQHGQNGEFFCDWTQNYIKGEIFMVSQWHLDCVLRISLATGPHLLLNASVEKNMKHKHFDGNTVSGVEYYYSKGELIINSR